MKQGLFTIAKNEAVAPNVYRMVLLGDTADILRPGQFVNISLTGKFLRRPISVCDWTAGLLTILYKVVGSGTEQMSRMKTGDTLDILVGLGNGYDMNRSGDTPLLIGGGAGIPPLYGLAKRLTAQGKQPCVILGFNTASERFLEAEFQELGVKTITTTADGSYGIRGFVTDAMADRDYTHVYVCGPAPMLRAVWERCTTSGQFSFEERMGCGFGACMGCSCETKYGNKRICREGPVLFKEEILW